MKSITTTGLGDSILVPEQRGRFLAAMETRAPILAAARRILMTSFQTNLDRFTYDGLLKPPQTEATEFTDTVDPTFATNTLTAVKVRGRTNISDEAMQDNQAKGNFRDELVDAMGRAAGVDLERLFVQGDTGSGDPYLALTDGWLVKSANAIDGGGTDFDATDVEDMFEAMLRSLDERFVDVADRSRIRFWVNWTIENDYREVLRERGTDLGDRAQTDNRPVPYKGFPVRSAPSIPSGTALLAHVDNMAYGIYQDIAVEAERQPSYDRTAFHVRARGDANFEDENGAVVATGYTGP